MILSHATSAAAIIQTGFPLPGRWICPVAFLFSLLSISWAQLCPDENLFFTGKEVGTLRANRLSAVAGIAASRRNPGVLWVHNDQAINRIFALNVSGRSLGTFTLVRPLTNAQDIACGPGPEPGKAYLYIGDIGDTTRQRTHITVVRSPEPEVDLDPEDQKTVPLPEPVYLNLKYPDEPHHAEALLIDPVAGDLIIVTHEPASARIYFATQEQLAHENPVLSFEGTIPLAQVTAGDIAPQGRELILRALTQALLWRRSSGESPRQTFLKTPWPVPLRPDGQGTALAFDSVGAGYLTASQGEDQSIFYFKRNNTQFSAGQKTGVVSSAKLTELSGLAVSRINPGVLWVHNDGEVSEMYALSTNGLLLGSFSFTETLVDFEDVAIGPGPDASRSYLYAGDIGDNSSARESVRVFRVPEPHLINRTEESQFEFSDEVIFTLKYPDGPHDAEALLIDSLTGDLYIITKERSSFRLYRTTREALDPTGTVNLQLVHTGAFANVSAADISSDGNHIAVRNEEAAQLWIRSSGENISETLKQPGEEIPVIGPPDEPNGEGISFTPDSRGYFTISEGENPVLHLFLPIETTRFAASPEKTATGWNLTLTGCSGTTVTVSRSSDLLNWTPVQTTILSGNANTIVDPVHKEARFYRIQENE